MKKLTSILLLLILFFNWYGYRILSGFLQSRADSRFEAVLNNNSYDEADLLEVRIPLDLPYQSNWKNFERYDGEIEINGMHYSYVKRKISDGQLVLLCLPNRDKSHLQSARDKFFKLVNDLQHPNQGKDQNSNTSFKNFTTEYYEVKNDWSIAMVPTQSTIPASNTFSFYLSFQKAIPAEPPELQA